MYACVCVCVFMCTYMHIYIYIYIYMYMCACVCVCLCFSGGSCGFGEGKVRAVEREVPSGLRKCREKYCGYTRRSPAPDEDRRIRIPDVIRPGGVARVLLDIAWPGCQSRQDMVPGDGWRYVEAFPVGLVNNYAIGLCLPRLATARGAFGCRRRGMRRERGGWRW